MVTYYFAFIALIAVERLFEMMLSRRHAKIAFAAGGIEVGQTHFFWMVVLHTYLLISCVGEVWFLHRPWISSLGIPMLLLAILAQGLRYWAITSLGEQWNVRVIVVPGRPVVQHGPYRFLRHPNYVAVALEGIALPLMHSAWITAVVFSLLNLILLKVRIASEETALRTHCSYDRAFGRA